MRRLKGPWASPVTRIQSPINRTENTGRGEAATVSAAAEEKATTVTAAAKKKAAAVSAAAKEKAAAVSAAADGTQLTVAREE